MNKIYITGFNGYLGSVICSLLPQEKIIKIGNPKKKYSDKKVIKYFPKKIEKNSICLHLASLSGEESEKNTQETYETNVLLTKKICDLDFKKIYFSSSSSVYGNSEKTFFENDIPNPTNYYSETKILGEEIVKKTEKNAILRIAVLMGCSPKTNWNMFINSLIKSAKQKKTINIFSPKCFRPYINVYDVAYSFKRLIYQNHLSGVFNLGFSDMNFNKMHIIKEVKKFFPNFNFNFKNRSDNPNYPVAPRNYKLNCDKIRKSLPQKTSLTKTIEEIINRIS